MGFSMLASGDRPFTPAAVCDNCGGPVVDGAGLVLWADRRGGEDVAVRGVVVLCGSGRCEREYLVNNVGSGRPAGAAPIVDYLAFLAGAIRMGGGGSAAAAPATEDRLLEFGPGRPTG